MSTKITGFMKDELVSSIVDLRNRVNSAMDRIDRLGADRQADVEDIEYYHRTRELLIQLREALKA